MKRKSCLGCFVIFLLSVIACYIIYLHAISNLFNTLRINKNEGETSLYLLRQRIPNSSKVIYKYSYAGEYAWSSSDDGQIILDSTEVFTWEKSRNKLPFHITDIDVQSNEIYCINFVSQDDGGRKEVYQKKYGEMKLNIKDQFKRGTRMGFFYKYGDFEETRDSIFFENLSVDLGILLPNRVGFKKGNFTVTEDSCGYVTRFENQIISLYPIWEKFQTQDTIDMAYTDSFLGTNRYDLPALSVIYTFNIQLKPDSTSKKRKVSDFGVFKKIVLRRIHE